MSWCYEISEVHLSVHLLRNILYVMSKCHTISHIEPKLKKIIVSRETVGKKTNMRLFSTSIAYVGNIVEFTSTGISILRLPLVDIL